jgi:hypothetical protein
MPLAESTTASAPAKVRGTCASGEVPSGSVAAPGSVPRAGRAPGTAIIGSLGFSSRPACTVFSAPIDIGNESGYRCPTLSVNHDRPRKPPRGGGFVSIYRACPICLTHDSAPVGHMPSPTHPMHMVACKSCGLVFVNPIYTQEEKEAVSPVIRLLHRSHSAEASQAAAFAHSRGRMRRCMDVLAPHLGRGDRVLEVGSGDGALLGLLARKGRPADGNRPGPGLRRGLRPDAGGAGSGRDLGETENPARNHLGT